MMLSPFKQEMLQAEVAAEKRCADADLWAAKATEVLAARALTEVKALTEALALALAAVRALKEALAARALTEALALARVDARVKD
jgi:hypothetical protein